VVAVESEREFGLSVLQRLDEELRRRGEAFRAAGVQDLKAYRNETGRKTPRLLLIVDEFQEFFVEDDKIAQDVTLLLDRLVRQGRAFGIHVLLGSQTLGGAYSLPRTTLGQMAVRIALQCSEADANLILSEENTAARLLTRPGEAIYNDANGRAEGNDFFQIVWLGDERREFYLERLRDLARERRLVPRVPQIVFEGNAPGELAKNHLLGDLLRASHWPTAPKASHAWLGEAMAIKDPTAVVFRAQSGGNVLVIGQQDEAALAIMASALLSLAAQHAPDTIRFVLLDGLPVDDPRAGWLRGISENLPHQSVAGGFRELPAMLGELVAEVTRRHAVGLVEAAPIFVFVHALHRFRDLRKGDDDFGFARLGEDQPASPSKLFADILKEGSSVGVHVLAWCDTLNNVNRSLDRSLLREFEHRVLFQMSQNDSSALIDAPTASRLGPNRALLYSEERGQPEKFRPYGLPTPEFLAEVKTMFARRGP
jgi:hypothetical protein